MGNRQNKSQRIVTKLENLAESNHASFVVAGKRTNIPLNLPDLKEAAKHIEWLELCLTGVSYKDRKTIAALTRRKTTLEQMVARRDEKIQDLKDQLRLLKKEHKKKIELIEEHHAQVEEELKAEASAISIEDKELIEDEFIKKLQTTHERERELQRTRIKGAAELFSSYKDNTVYHWNRWD